MYWCCVICGWREREDNGGVGGSVGWLVGLAGLGWAGLGQGVSESDRKRQKETERDRKRQKETVQWDTRSIGPSSSSSLLL